MKKNQQPEVQQNGILDNMASGLKKNRNILLGALALIIAAVAVYGIYENIQNKRYQKLWGDFFVANLSFVADENHPLTEIENFIAKNQNTEAAAYAEFTLGNANYQIKDYAKAAQHFRQVIAGPNKNMAALGEVSLIASLVAANAYSDAIAQADNFAAKHPAHYALGQVKHYKALAQELSGQKAAAKETYNQLIADYPNSYYALFAKMRLDALK